jgi:hypothetical protein
MFPSRSAVGTDRGIVCRTTSRPIATLSIEAQERRERFDRFYRDE